MEKLIFVIKKNSGYLLDGVTLLQTTETDVLDGENTLLQSNPGWWGNINTKNK